MASDYEKRVLDKAFETSLALWNALLTAHSVLGAVGSALAAIVPTSPVWIWCGLLVFCAGSILLLLKNFRGTRAVYDVIGATIQGRREPGDGDKRAADLEHEKTRARESVAVWCLFGELALIIVGLLWGRL